jgi:phosphoribosylformylglycinamidine synthase
MVAGKPELDLSLEVRVQNACRRLVREGVINSAHDCSDGGLLVTLAESCISGGIGLAIQEPIPGRWDAAFFGERQSRIVISLPRTQMSHLSEMCAAENAPWCEIGTVGGDSLTAGTMLSVSIDTVKKAWKNGLETALRPAS